MDQDLCIIPKPKKNQIQKLLTQGIFNIGINVSGIKIVKVYSMYSILINTVFLLSFFNIYSQIDLRQIDSIFINNKESLRIQKSYAELFKSSKAKDKFSINQELFTVYYTGNGRDNLRIYLNNEKVMDTVFSGYDHITRKLIDFELSENDNSQVNVIKIESLHDHVFYKLKLDSTDRSLIITPHTISDSSAAIERKGNHSGHIRPENVSFLKNNIQEYIEVLKLNCDYYDYLKLLYDKYGYY